MQKGEEIMGIMNGKPPITEREYQEWKKEREKQREKDREKEDKLSSEK